MNRDKILHHLVGFLGFYFVAGVILLFSGAINPLGFIIAGFASHLFMGFIAYLKEAHDESRAGATVDVIDAETTIGGSKLAFAIYLVILLVSQS